MRLNDKISALFAAQVAEWETAARNYEALRRTEIRTFDVDGYTFRLQYNPERIRSSAANVDTTVIRQRPCFLCAANRPAEQQGIDCLGHYTVLVNPYPIFPRHLTIIDQRHIGQRIENRFGDMLEFARNLPDFVVFYNGANCGASAPDHAHFQAGNKGFLPIEQEIIRRPHIPLVRGNGDATLFSLHGDLRHALIMASSSADNLAELFDRVYRVVGEMVNILAWYINGRYLVCVFPRKSHRPRCFGQGEGQFTVSPAAVDLGGVLITPIERDFQLLTQVDLRQILQDVCIDRAQFQIFVQQIKEQQINVAV
ncbi:MAG: DUF4922 domain-containing protein [Prevotellaceae bacterium]|nr:DUF4922 domain-containing protein [Prevotellaceae bacterium]